MLNAFLNWSPWNEWKEQYCKRLKAVGRAKEKGGECVILTMYMYKDFAFFSSKLG